MQILQSLAIGYIGLASRNIFYVVGVDQEDLESPRLQDLKQRNPVHPRRFHRYRLHVARLQPVRRRVQVFREGRKTPHRLRMSSGIFGFLDFRPLVELRSTGRTNASVPTGLAQMFSSLV